MFGWSRRSPAEPATPAWLAARGPLTNTVHNRLRQGRFTILRDGDLTLAYRNGSPQLLQVHRDTCGSLIASIGDTGYSGCAVRLDSARSTLEARCDPFGARGLCASEDAGAVWCASDPLVLAYALGRRAVNAAALHGYLCFSYVPTPESIFAGMRSVPAGGRLTVSGGTFDIDCGVAWQEREPDTADEEGAVERLRSLLREAVGCRLPGVRRAGVFLSGGLDSSVIAALLVRAGVRVTAFTLDFGPPFDTELAHARRVATHLGIPLRVVAAGPPTVRAALASTAAALQQPFGDAVTVPLYLLGEAAARETDVVFNGEGGDQLFGGWTNKPMIAAETYGGAAHDRERSYMDTFHRFFGRTDALYRERARIATQGIDAVAWVRPVLRGSGNGSLIHLLRSANLRLKGAQNIAPRATQLGAAHGLRVEMPFFDRALTDWTFGLPSEWFLRGATEKHLLKRAAEPLLPPEIVWREKRGMGVPVTEWCLGPLRRETGRWLSARALRVDGWFAPAAVEALRRGEDSEREFRHRRAGEKLWALLMWQVWKAIHEVHPL